MANIFTTAFVINGMLSNSFTSSTKMANSQLTELHQTVKRIDLAQKKLNAEFTNGAMSVEQYERKMGRYQDTLNKTQQQQKLLQDRLNKKNIANSQFVERRQSFLTTAAAIGTIAQPFISAAQTAMKFEFAMSKVGAIANATGPELSLLTQTARSLGEQTKFTATQSAEAMSYLGMAGWKTNEIVAGMPGLLNLAAAGNTDLARTADIVSDNLTAFGLSADKAQHMADVYAVTITSTNTNVEMLGETMKYAAPVAHAFGASMEETAALAGIMANSGIKASNAGTALRAGLIRLAGPPKMASKALEQLGLSMEDLTNEQKEAAMALKTLGIETGNAEGPQKMAIIVGQLQERMKGLSKEEQLAMSKAIFGQQAAAGWLAVLQAGPKVLGDLTNSLVNSDGASEKMAKQMNANAEGAIIRLFSAFESLQISLANGFLPVIANVGDSLAVWTGKLSALATAHPIVAQGIIYTIGTFGLLWLTFKTGRAIISGYNAFMATCALWQTTLGNCTAVLRSKTMLLAGTQRTVALATKLWSGGRMLVNAAMAACPIGWLLIGISLLVVAGTILYRHWDTVKQFFTTLWDSPIARIAFFVTGPVGWIIGAVTAIIANWDTLAAYWDYFWDNPSAAIFRFTSYIQEQFTSAETWLREKWQSISNFLSTPIFGKVNITASGNGAEVAENAYGGIYGRGTFLTTFAENSGESAIPHTPNKRNIGLLAKTNEIMGNPLGTSGSINATFAPQITVQGNTDTAEISTLLDQKMREFKAMLAEVQNQNRRLSYG